MEENIVISNREELEKIKYKIARDGVSRFHVLADFDRTLTKNFVNGKEVPSIISVLRNGNFLTKDYAEKAHALFDKYHPIEINSKISLKEKKKAMHEWWTAHFKLLVESKLNIKDIEEVIKSEDIRLREGALEFFDLLHKHRIPLVVMSSAGLGDEAISLILKKEDRLYDNVYIISNSFKYDKKGDVIGIKKPIIHSMNKDETMVKDFPSVYKTVKDRKNVLLLGDNLEDIDMIKGFDYDRILKIGFLNKNVKESLKYYKKAYDVVILNDSGMAYVNKLLKEIVQKSR